jgi:hypothetical protein
MRIYAKKPTSGTSPPTVNETQELDGPSQKVPSGQDCPLPFGDPHL